MYKKIVPFVLLIVLISNTLTFKGFAGGPKDDIAIEIYYELDFYGYTHYNYIHETNRVFTDSERAELSRIYEEWSSPLIANMEKAVRSMLPRTNKAGVIYVNDPLVVKFNNGKVHETIEWSTYWGEFTARGVLYSVGKEKFYPYVTEVISAPKIKGYKVSRMNTYGEVPGRPTIVSLVPEKGFPKVDYSSVKGTPKSEYKYLAKSTTSEIIVNGKKIAFDAYNVEGSNYIKLRDLAYVLNGTNKQFEIKWDEKQNAITVTSGKKYIAIGNEMQINGKNQYATETESKLYFNGNQYMSYALTINGNNYFGIRSLGRALNFSVQWNETTDTITIDTRREWNDYEN